MKLILIEQNSLMHARLSRNKMNLSQDKHKMKITITIKL